MMSRAAPEEVEAVVEAPTVEWVRSGVGVRSKWEIVVEEVGRVVVVAIN